MLCCFFNSYSFFDAWNDYNKKNREEIYNLITGNKVNNFNNVEDINRNIKKDNENYDREKKLTFKDIIGGVPQEILDLKAFLNNDESFKALGAEKPKGILLVGPPGTGKTMLARAVAGELNAEFFATSASSFIEIYVGTGPRKIREIFENASYFTNKKKGNKAIIFIDEIDALGKRNTGEIRGGDSERNNTINELLVQLDGFNKNSNIIVMAATNIPDSLDQALLRPGRFDYIVNIPLPDFKKRCALLTYYLSKNNRKIDPNINIEDFARKTESFNCAEINDLVNKAAIHAVRNKQKNLLLQNLESAYNEIKEIKNLYR